MKLAPLLFALAVVSLPGCKQEGAQVPAKSVEAKAGVTLGDGTLRLPAVKGNPGAAYFTITNTAASGSVSVTGVTIAGAGKTEMHQTKDGVMSPVDRLDVEAGGTIKFAPGGLHVMAFDLDPSLTAGGTTELTVNFADGTKAVLPLALEAAGSAEHGGSH